MFSPTRNNSVKREKERGSLARRDKGLSVNETTKNYYRMIPRRREEEIKKGRKYAREYNGGTIAFELRPGCT